LLLNYKKTEYTTPTVLPFTNVNYTISLITDPIDGPPTTTVNITAGTTLQIRLSQVTAGPNSSVVISFGDGSANQTIYSLMVGSPVNISHNYTTPGTFVITGTATLYGLTGVNTNVAPMTVTMPPPPYYNGNFKFPKPNYYVFINL
jgi:hypothetical protein